MQNLFLFLPLISALNPSTWISDSLPTIGNLSLKNLTLPGTHDSGAYYLTSTVMPTDDSLLTESNYNAQTKLNKNVPKIAKNWSQTQDRTLYQQLQDGIRYFDIRAGWNNITQQWVVYHFLEGAEIRYLLQNISEFLYDHDEEVVIVEISHFSGDPSEDNVQGLREIVVDEIGDFLFPCDYSLEFTVNEMVSSGKRVLVTMEEGFDNETIWDGDVIYNTYANTPDLKKMVAYNNEKVQEFMQGEKADQYFKISWTLTPNSKTIIGSTDPFNPSKPDSLIALADTANKELASFYDSISKNGWKMGNILIVDHYETSKIMDVVWAMNGLDTATTDLTYSFLSNS